MIRQSDLQSGQREMSLRPDAPGSGRRLMTFTGVRSDQDGGTTTSGTRISSRLTPPCTPMWRNGFSSATRSRIA